MGLADTGRVDRALREWGRAVRLQHERLMARLPAESDDGPITDMLLYVEAVTRLRRIAVFAMEQLGGDDTIGAALARFDEVVPNTQRTLPLSGADHVFWSSDNVIFAVEGQTISTDRATPAAEALLEATTAVLYEAIRREAQQ